MFEYAALSEASASLVLSRPSGPTCSASIRACRNRVPSRTQTGSTQTCIRAVFTSTRLTGKFSFSKDGTPSQIGSLHHAAQRFAQVRRDRMPVVQSIFCHNEFAVGLEHDEVCITPRGDPTLARVKT